ncbi:hypothetical protein ACJZ2D_002527 [Fusarium nematophilum]
MKTSLKGIGLPWPRESDVQVPFYVGLKGDIREKENRELLDQLEKEKEPKNQRGSSTRPTGEIEEPSSQNLKDWILERSARHQQYQQQFEQKNQEYQRQLDLGRQRQQYQGDLTLRERHQQPE